MVNIIDKMFRIAPPADFLDRNRDGRIRFEGKKSEIGAGLKDAAMATGLQGTDSFDAKEFRVKVEEAKATVSKAGDSSGVLSNVEQSDRRVEELWKRERTARRWVAVAIAVVPVVGLLAIIAGVFLLGAGAGFALPILFMSGLSGPIGGLIGSLKLRKLDKEIDKAVAKRDEALQRLLEQANQLKNIAKSQQRIQEQRLG